jgi:hypothetical protein
LRRWVERQQPQAGDAETREVGQLIRETDEIADAVAVRVDEGLDVQAIDDGVLVPEIVDHAGDLSKAGAEARRSRAEVDTYQDRCMMAGL